MIDFTDMEVGVITTSNGFIIILKGTFYGPFNRKQAEKIADMMEEDLRTRF